MQQRITVLINTETAPDVWAWIQAQPPDGRSAAIREAIRTQIKAEKSGEAREVTLADILAELQEIKRNGVFLASGGDAAHDEPEPERAAANLDKLGL